MKKIFHHTTTAAAILLSLTGCEESRSPSGGGAGTGGTVTGTTVKAVKLTAHGYTPDKKLAYVIYTDIDQDAMVAGVGGDWSGWMGPKGGRQVVVYQADPDGIDINGTVYPFTGGRVFLIETAGGTVSVKQLNLPISDAEYETEKDRITALEEVQDFLNQ